MSILLWYAADELISNENLYDLLTNGQEVAELLSAMTFIRLYFVTNTQKNETKVFDGIGKPTGDSIG